MIVLFLLRVAIGVALIGLEVFYSQRWGAFVVLVAFLLMQEIQIQNLKRTAAGFRKWRVRT